MRQVVRFFGWRVSFREDRLTAALDQFLRRANGKIGVCLYRGLDPLDLGRDRGSVARLGNESQVLKSGVRILEDLAGLEPIPYAGMPECSFTS